MLAIQSVRDTAAAPENGHLNRFQIEISVSEWKWNKERGSNSGEVCKHRTGDFFLFFFSCKKQRPGIGPAFVTAVAFLSDVLKRAARSMKKEVKHTYKNPQAGTHCCACISEHTAPSTQLQEHGLTRTIWQVNLQFNFKNWQQPKTPQGCSGWKESIGWRICGI